MKKQLNIIAIALLAIAIIIPTETHAIVSQTEGPIGGSGSRMYRYVPTITSGNSLNQVFINHPEGQKSVTTITVDTPTPGNIVYSLSAGDDLDTFFIDPETGELAFKLAPVYENPTDKDNDNTYNVQVKVENYGHNPAPFDLQDIFITVIDSSEIGGPIIGAGGDPDYTEDTSEIVNAPTKTNMNTTNTPITCSPYINSYIHIGRKNNDEDVKKLKKFLNDYEGESLDVNNSEYTQDAYEAVIRFQEKYTKEVLTPWGITQGTGYVYITTTRQINNMMCGITYN